jgi:hypothetical protein
MDKVHAALAIITYFVNTSESSVITLMLSMWERSSLPCYLKQLLKYNYESSLLDNFVTLIVFLESDFNAYHIGPATNYLGSVK